MTHVHFARPGDAFDSGAGGSRRRFVDLRGSMGEPPRCCRRCARTRWRRLAKAATRPPCGAAGSGARHPAARRDQHRRAGRRRARSRASRDGERARGFRMGTPASRSTRGCSCWRRCCNWVGWTRRTPRPHRRRRCAGGYQPPRRPSVSRGVIDCDVLTKRRKPEMPIPRSPYPCCPSRRWPTADERALDEARERVPCIGVAHGKTSRNDPPAAAARQRSGPAPWAAYAATTAASVA